MKHATPNTVEPLNADALRVGPPLAAERPLPMSRADMDDLGWDQCDIILVSGDAYVDHPAFGVALIARLLTSHGYRVGIIAQPDVRQADTFARLGIPRLFWGITAGNVDSRLSQLTVMRKRRRDDPYAPNGTPGLRPANAGIVYTACVRRVGGGVPVVLGGLEASLRRFAFYDFWTDKIRRSMLVDAKADLLVYGMGERAVLEIARRRVNDQPLDRIAGTAQIVTHPPGQGAGSLWLPAYDTLTGPDSREAYLSMTRALFLRHPTDSDTAIVQPHGSRYVVVYPAAAPLSTSDMDYLYGLPFSRRPHPAYDGRRIPAFDMIRHSVTTHRGCYGGCAFCAIGVHQGSVISSRSPDNILDEIKTLAKTPTFDGTITDLGGPTANMYATACRLTPQRCPGRRCLFPTPCPNLNTDLGPLTRLLQRARNVKGVRHVYCASGIRPDLTNGPGGLDYIRELARHHVGGRLKIAPEHVCRTVLDAMRKPGREWFDRFLNHFHAATDRPYPVVEYYLSGHPGCTLDDMLELAIFLNRRRIRPEQVQDFYPAPMTLATAMHYTGRDPLTGKPVTPVSTDRGKADQRALLLCHLPDYQSRARKLLHAMGRDDLIGHAATCLVPPLNAIPRSKPRSRKHEGTEDPGTLPVTGNLAATRHHRRSRHRG